MNSFKSDKPTMGGETQTVAEIVEKAVALLIKQGHLEEVAPGKFKLTEAGKAYVEKLESEG
ncbi:MAG: hypothetical protein K8L97_25160 [Anaerolineae bacterium]|nr:hypothetical protein [Anaerolineae bacterium]